VCFPKKDRAKIYFVYYHSKLDQRHARKTEKENLLAGDGGGRGVVEEPNHTMARKPGPL
jgi:hypothetical protein